MLSSRAGLAKTFSVRVYNDRCLLKMVAVLLLFISLSAVMVQAAPVPVPSPTSVAGCELAVTSVGHCGATGHISSGVVHHVAHSESKLSAEPPSSQAPIHPPELARREEVEMVVLYRRKSIFSKIKAAFHHIGHAIKHAFKKVGEGIKHVAQKVAHGVAHVAKKVAHGIVHAAKKVGHFIKTTGAKIAKVGLKIVATAQKIASKVVGWLPGIGKPLGKVMEGESEGLNKASDAIHVHIGGKLGQAMHRMDKAQHVVGYIPRSVIPDGDEWAERDLDDYLEERDLGLWDAWENFAERSLDDEEVYLF